MTTNNFMVQHPAKSSLSKQNSFRLFKDMQIFDSQHHMVLKPQNFSKGPGNGGHKRGKTAKHSTRAAKNI